VRFRRLLLLGLLVVVLAGMSMAVEAASLSGIGGKAIDFIKIYFHYKVLINTVIVSGLVFLFYNWKFGKTEGKTKTVILVVLVVMIYFLSISPLLPGKSAAGDTSKYKFIWNVKAVEPIKNFFIGDDGIFKNPTKLITFVVSFALLYTGFSFLKIGGAGETVSQGLAPILSVLIAYNLTQVGVNRRTLVIMGMIIVGWILFQQTKESIPNVYGRGTAIIALVVYVGYGIIGFEGPGAVLTHGTAGAIKQAAGSSFLGLKTGAVVVAIVILIIIEVAFKMRDT